jgi:uncharacterized protein
MIEKQSFSLELKALSDEGTFEGYAAIFGNIDQGGDRIVPGAFAKSLKAVAGSGSVKMLWNHNPFEPIGVWDELVEDTKGLFGRGRLILDVAKAKEVHALIKAKAIGGLSIGYKTIKDAIENGVRLIKEADLFEISPVTFPMNTAAKITAFKSEGLTDIVDKLATGDRLTEREFERMAKGLGLSNAQAERAARIHLKGQGEPVKAEQEAIAFLKALRG